MVVACSARDILVTGQDFIVEKQLPYAGLIRFHGDVIICCDYLCIGQICTPQNEEQSSMQDVCKAYALCRALCLIAVFWAAPAQADMETARDLMEAGEYTEARALFEVYARSGNAEAEELIGVMYALGLGVPRDDERAFDWYLRASLKGHPGAQSGLGWYYEVGRGIPAPDMVRAYLWYALSAIGGDPDALDSLELITPRLTAEQRARAEVLVDDYKGWMYPFR